MTSRNNTILAIDKLNHDLQRLGGNDFTQDMTMYVAKRPDFKVLTVDPLAYEAYGRLRNRGPRIVGRFAVEGFAAIPGAGSDETFVYTMLRAAGDEVYGSGADSNVLNGVAHALGHDDVVFRHS